MTTSAWDEVAAAIEAVPYPVSVLQVDSARGAECVDQLGITTRSWLGAVVANTGGLLVDHGWLRVLGSGAESLAGILDVIDAESGHLPVAYDVLGGEFIWTPNAEGRPTIHYFGPDVLEWQDLKQGYADWLAAVLAGSLDGLYKTLRWPGWQQEVAEVPADQGIHTWPPPWSQEGKDLSAVSRKVLSLAELVSFHRDSAQKLGL